MNEIQLLEDRLISTLGPEQAQEYALSLRPAFVKDVQQAALSQARVEQSFLRQMVEKNPQKEIGWYNVKLSWLWFWLLNNI